MQVMHIISPFLTLYTFPQTEQMVSAGSDSHRTTHLLSQQTISLGRLSTTGSILWWQITTE